MALVVEGEFWFQLDGQPEKVLRAGESLATPDRANHNEGALGQAVKLTAVYVVEKGKPLVSPAP
jgi:quercetin dioxygenase-like cupin family protein